MPSSRLTTAPYTKCRPTGCNMTLMQMHDDNDNESKDDGSNDGDCGNDLDDDCDDR